MENKFILFSLIMAFGMLFTYFFIPSCLFHEDYITFAKAIEKYQTTHNIEGNVNGKHLFLLIVSNFYVATQGIIPFVKIETSMKLLSIIVSFASLVVFYNISKLKYSESKSLFLTFVYGTTATFITLFGHPESAIFGTLFILLSYYWFEKNSLVSYFFVFLSTFIRSEFILFYIPLFLFKRIKSIEWLLIFISIGNLIINSHKSDIGFNPISFIPFFLSFGILWYVLIGYFQQRYNKQALIFLIPALFYLFLVLEQSQKLYYVFVPFGILLFADKLWENRKTIFILAIINLIVFGIVAVQRQQYCASTEMAEFVRIYDVKPNDFTILTDYYNNKTSNNNAAYIFDVEQEKYSNLTKIKCGDFENFKDSNFWFYRKIFCVWQSDIFS